MIYIPHILFFANSRNPEACSFNLDWYQPANLKSIFIWRYESWCQKTVYFLDEWWSFLGMFSKWSSINTFLFVCSESVGEYSLCSKGCPQTGNAPMWTSQVLRWTDLSQTLCAWEWGIHWPSLGVPAFHTGIEEICKNSSDNLAVVEKPPTWMECYITRMLTSWFKYWFSHMRYKWK